jgi:hypothetical protein
LMRPLDALSYQGLDSMNVRVLFGAIFAEVSGGLLLCCCLLRSLAKSTLRSLATAVPHLANAFSA